MLEDVTHSDETHKNNKSLISHKSFVDDRCTFCANCQYSLNYDDSNVDLLQKNCLLKLCCKKIPKVILMQINVQNEKLDLNVSNNHQDIKRYRRVKCQNCKECKRPACKNCFACCNKAYKQTCIEKRCKLLQLPKAAVCYLCTSKYVTDRGNSIKHSVEDDELLECVICRRVSHKSCHETSGDVKSKVVTELKNYWQCPKCKGKTIMRKKIYKMKQFSESGATNGISYQSPVTSLNDCIKKDLFRVQIEKKIKQLPKVAPSSNMVCKPLHTTATSNEIIIKNSPRRQPCDDYKGKYTRKYQIRFKDYQNQSLPQLSIIPNGLILELFSYWQKANKEKRQEWNYLIECIRLLSASLLKKNSDKELGEKVYQCLHDTKKFRKDNKLSSSIINHESESVLDAPFCTEPVRTVKNSKGLSKLKVNEKSKVKTEPDIVKYDQGIKSDEIKIVVDEYENIGTEPYNLTFDEEIEVKDETCLLTDQLKNNSMVNEGSFLGNKQVTLVNEKIIDTSIISSPIIKVIGKQDKVIFQNKNNVSKITFDADECFQSISKKNNSIGLSLVKETKMCLHLDDYNDNSVKLLKHIGNQANDRTFTLEECIQAIEEEVCSTIDYIDSPVNVSFCKNVIKGRSQEYQNVDLASQVEGSDIIITDDISIDSSLMTKQDTNLEIVKGKEAHNLKHNDRDHANNQNIINRECSVITNEEESQACCNVENTCKFKSPNNLVDMSDECLNIEDKGSIVKSANIFDKPFARIKDNKKDILGTKTIKLLNSCEGASINSKEANTESYVHWGKDIASTLEGSTNNYCVKASNSQVIANEERAKILKDAALNDLIKERTGVKMIITDDVTCVPKEMDATVNVAKDTLSYIKCITNSNDCPTIHSLDINTYHSKEKKDDTHVCNHKEMDCLENFNVKMCHVSNVNQVSIIGNTDNFSQATSCEEPAIILKEGNRNEHIMKNGSQESLKHDYEYEVMKSKSIVFGSNMTVEEVKVVTNEKVIFDNAKLIIDNDHDLVLNSNSCLKKKENMNVSSFQNIENKKCCQIASTGTDDSNPTLASHNIEYQSDSNLERDIASMIEGNASGTLVGSPLEPQQFTPIMNADENIDGSYNTKSANEFAFKKSGNCFNVDGSYEMDILNKNNVGTQELAINETTNISHDINKNISSLPILSDLKTNSSLILIDNLKDHNFINANRLVTEPNATNYFEITTCTTNSSQEYSELDSGSQVLSVQDISAKSCLVAHSLDDPMQVLLEACTQIDRDQKKKSNDLNGIESPKLLMETCAPMSTDKVCEHELLNHNCLVMKSDISTFQNCAKSDSKFCRKYKRKNNYLKCLARYKTKYVKIKSKLYTLSNMRKNAVQVFSNYRSELFEAYEEDMSKSNLVNQLEDQLKCSKSELSLMKNNIQKLNLEKIDIMKSLIDKSKKIIFLENKVNELVKVNEELKEKKPELVTMIGGQFTSEVNDVFKELLACNVPIEKIPNLIRITVENLTGMVVTELPFDSFLTEIEKDKPIHLDSSKLFKDDIRKDKDKETLIKSRVPKKIATKETEQIAMATKDTKISDLKNRDQALIKNSKLKRPNNIVTSQIKEKLNSMKALSDLKANTHQNNNVSSSSKIKNSIEGEKNISNNKFINKLKDNATKTYESQPVKTENKNYPNQEREKLGVVFKTNDDKLKSDMNIKHNKLLRKNSEVNKEDQQYSSIKKDKDCDQSIASKSVSDKQKRPQRTTANCYEYRQLNNGIYDRRDKGSNDDSSLAKKSEYKKCSVKEVVSHRNDGKLKVHTKSAAKDRGKRRRLQIESDDSSDIDSYIKSKRKKPKHKKYTKVRNKQNLLSSICNDDDNITVEEDGTIVIGSLAKLFGL